MPDFRRQIPPMRARIIEALDEAETCLCDNPIASDWGEDFCARCKRVRVDDWDAFEVDPEGRVDVYGSLE